VILVTSAGTVPAQAARFMPITLVLAGRAFDLEVIESMSAAFVAACDGLQLATIRRQDLSPRKSSNSRSVASATPDVLRTMTLSSTGCPLCANRRYALDHCNALSECSNIRKILPKILFLAAGSILIGIAYVSDRCSLSRATT
jgi:hypothetical protein